MITRRQAIIGLGVSALLPAYAPGQPRQPIQIGFLNAQSREQVEQDLISLNEGMAALGWKAGVDYSIESRWADGVYDRLPALAQDLAEKKLRLVIAAPSQAVAAAAKAMPDISIVVASGDPLAAGLVSSLAKPGGNITGVSNVVIGISGKLIEILLDTLPKLRRIGFLGDISNPNHQLMVSNQQRDCARLSVEGRWAEARQPQEIAPALRQLAKMGTQALVIEPGPLFGAERRAIMGLATELRWPVIAGQDNFAEAGALVTYAPNRAARLRRVATYVDKILKGAKPADLPIEQPTTFDLIVNVKAAKALGLKIPNSILVQATKVIE